MSLKEADCINIPLSKPKSKWPALVEVKLNKKNYVNIKIVAHPWWSDRKHSLSLNKKLTMALLIQLPRVLEETLKLEKSVKKQSRKRASTADLVGDKDNRYTHL
jgi:hypothetical protein